MEAILYFFFRIFNLLISSKSFLDNIMEFLRNLPTYHVTPVRCGSNALDEPIVQAIEDEVDKIKVKSYANLRLH